jgi:hypothetical protein
MTKLTDDERQWLQAILNLIDDYTRELMGLYPVKHPCCCHGQPWPW